MVGIRTLIKGILLLPIALVIFSASVQAAWPEFPADADIQEAIQSFVQENTYERDVRDCSAISDRTERSQCLALRGPVWLYRSEIVETATLKMHHPSQPDPLLGSAVVLLYTTKNWVGDRDSGRYTTLSYGKAVLVYGGYGPDKEGWHFTTGRWWEYDPADLSLALLPPDRRETTIGEPGDTSTLTPREHRDATVYVLFQPRNARGHYGWVPGYRRNLTVVGYNGDTDPLRMPLTFWIKLEDMGKPVADAAIPFAVEGDVKCVADTYAVWDSGNQRWVDGWNNFSLSTVGGDKAPLTDRDGMVIIRLFLDFERMRMFTLQLPCTLRLVAYAPNAHPASPHIREETSIQVNTPAFLRSVLYLESAPRAVLVPAGAPHRPLTGQILWLSQLPAWETPFPPNDPNNPPPPYEIPTQARVLSRIRLDEQAFVPPSELQNYYHPLKPGTVLAVDASSTQLPVHADGSDRPWAVPPGDGIGVIVMWLDGSTGLFLVNNRSPDIESILAMRFVQGWYSTEGRPMSDDLRRAIFVVGQGVDIVVKTIAVGGATALGGPVAGKWAGVIVESAQRVNDANSLREIARRNTRVIWIRSIVALISGMDGRNTFYVFEGAPSIEDDMGNEVAISPGQAVEFALEGEIVGPAVQEPPPVALAMLETLAYVDAPFAAVSDIGTPAGEEAPAARGEDRTWRNGALGPDGSGLLDDLVSDLSDEEWMAVFGAGALVLVVVIGAVARGRGRRGRTITAQSGDFAMLPDKSPTVTPAKRGAPARVPATPRPHGPATPPRAPIPSPADAPIGAPPGLSCAHCGQPVRAAARFCAHCGEPREAVVTPPPADAPVAAPPEPTCARCGQPVRATARFCAHCGEPRDVTVADKRLSQPRR